MTVDISALQTEIRKFIKATLKTSVSSTPADTNVLSEKATVDYVNAKIEEAGNLIGDP